MSKALFLFAGLVLVLGCSKVDEMQATTNKMSETTEQMNGKMSETNKNTSEVLKVSKDTVRTVRPGGALEARNNALKFMKESESMGAKLSYAAKYFYAFEFQYWTSEVDTRTHREELKGLAADEFFKEVRQFTKTNFEPLSPAQQGLYALAATLHEKDYFQIAAAKEAGIPESSMLDMIEEGLRSKELVNQGKLRGNQVSLSTSTVLQNEENAVLLVKSRQNFLLLMALCEAYDMGERKGALIWSTVVLETIHRFGRDVHLKLENKNVRQVQWQNRYLRGSLRMRKLLLDLKYNADLESGLLVLNLPYVYGKIAPVDNKTTFSALSGLQKNEINTYARLLQLVRMPDAEFKKVSSEEYVCTELDCGQN